MNLPDPKTLDLVESVLAEPGAGDGRIVLWLPIRREAGDRLWERVGTAARPPVTEAGGLYAASATSTGGWHCWPFLGATGYTQQAFILRH